MDRLRVHYEVRGPAAEIGARAEALALEQSVEVPRVVVRDDFVEKEILARVESVAPADDGAHRVTISIPERATAADPDVRCVDVELTDSLLAALGGPRFGVAGFREVAGVAGRPLTCTALKPMGQSPEALADLFGTFARAGIDVIKDDHGLAEHDFCPFEARVRACLRAEAEAAEATGRRSLYVPNLIGTPDTVFRQLEFAQAQGARAVMMSPMLLGLPTFWEVCRRRSDVPVLAHPSFSGAQRIAPDVLFGRLYRLYGADAVIFVNFGSRFAAGRERCRQLAKNLAEPLSGILPSLPVAGGGIRVETAAEVASFYGRDVVLLVGGDLQVEADRVFERSRALALAVAACA
jgi:ribulose-bisphosphate carboxylase large chain